MIKKNKKIHLNPLKRVNDGKMRRVLCLLSYQPTKTLIELFVALYNKNEEYDYYVVVDDNDFGIDNLKNEFPEIKWIKIEEDECKRLGYQNINFLIKKGEPSAWDKAFCYFCEKGEMYDQYWFMEDDVFIPRTDDLYKIDEKYVDDDILLNKKNIDFLNKMNPSNRQIFEINKYMNKEYEKSLCKSMVCIVRLSNNMIKIVKEYVNKYKTMFFLEFFLCTLANYHKVKINVIEELSTVRFRRIWQIEKMIEHENYVYHPIKNIDLQKAYRKFFEPNEYLFMTNEDLKKRIKNMKKVSENLIQIVLLKKNDQRMKVTDEWSLKGEIQENNSQSSFQRGANNEKIKHKNYVDYCKIFPEKRVFYYRFDIPSMKEACAYLHVQGYEFESFYMMIEEVYEDKDVMISIMNIPQIIEYVKIHSYSKDKLEECCKRLNLEKKYSKSFDEIVKDTNKRYGLDIRPSLSLEFETVKKIIKYVSINQNSFKNLTEYQFILYESLKSSMGKSLNIYNEKEVKLWM